jgi:hypothetical protein
MTDSEIVQKHILFKYKLTENEHLRKEYELIKLKTIRKRTLTVQSLMATQNRSPFQCEQYKVKKLVHTDNLTLKHEKPCITSSGFTTPYFL